jgi:hypothetical protein
MGCSATDEDLIKQKLSTIKLNLFSLLQFHLGERWEFCHTHSQVKQKGELIAIFLQWLSEGCDAE